MSPRRINSERVESIISDQIEQVEEEESDENDGVELADGDHTLAHNRWEVLTILTTALFLLSSIIIGSRPLLSYTQTPRLALKAELWGKEQNYDVWWIMLILSALWLIVRLYTHISINPKQNERKD